MKCIIPIKRVIDPYVNIRVKADHTGVETANVKMAINPFDEIAIEEAVRLKEQGVVNNIEVVSIGIAANLQETMRQALARGADAATIIDAVVPAAQAAEAQIEPLTIAKILCQFVKQEAAQLVLLGKQAIDDDNNQTGQMLAALLGWPQGTFASKITVNDKQSITVTREIDGGLETIKLTIPAVITTDLRLNEPRYISLPNVMQAKRKPLAVKNVAELGIDLKNFPRTVETLTITPPKPRVAGVKVNTVAELIEKLKFEAKVL